MDQFPGSGPPSQVTREREILGPGDVGRICQ